MGMQFDVDVSHNAYVHIMIGRVVSMHAHMQSPAKQLKLITDVIVCAREDNTIITTISQCISYRE